eukprot:4467595-Prorocentrum_lima.AAC.1
MEALLLIAKSHHEVLTILSEKLGVHIQGLHQGAAMLARSGEITNRTRKKLERLDNAFNLSLIHISEPTRLDVI